MVFGFKNKKAHVKSRMTGRIVIDCSMIRIEIGLKLLGRPAN